jgi:sirohydrochlorin ferrochelatase
MPLATAILLMGHGSRVAEANAVLHRVADMVARQGGFAIVEVVFHARQPPNVQTGIDACVVRGAQRNVLYPYFLYPGAHVLEGLPAELQRAARRHPGLELVLSTPLGVHPKLAEVVCERINATLLAAGWQE